MRSPRITPPSARIRPGAREKVASASTPFPTVMPGAAGMRVGGALGMVSGALAEPASPAISAAVGEPGAALASVMGGVRRLAARSAAGGAPGLPGASTRSKTPSVIWRAQRPGAAKDDAPATRL
ncbi:hypothetical protein [Rubrimonas cliftonensis]|uniref:Uncharacterized protein n=1 Tax=Rubrimonas cliftonensis TaxID=89524 RepID=A0A1H4D8B0_9RHOB|nr:hypothetical protein [Rubrimonas cliftonensis]SEA68921.1 hypothetical protein SAMN05444370_10994 [Rubrimonas cliftonensis]